MVSVRSYGSRSIGLSGSRFCRYFRELLTIPESDTHVVFARRAFSDAGSTPAASTNSFRHSLTITHNLLVRRQCWRGSDNFVMIDGLGHLKCISS